MRTPTFIVKPHPQGGAQLTGPGLRWALWYDDECAAASYAHSRLAATGGRVVFYGVGGMHIITERVDAPGTIQGSAHGMR